MRHKAETLLKWGLFGFYVTTSDVLNNETDKKSRKASIWQMFPDIWNLSLLSGWPVPQPLESFHLFSLPPSIIQTSACSKKSKKEKKNLGRPPPTSPVSALSHRLATSPPYFHVWHILSRSALFIHRFILPNLPSSSTRLMFPSLCPSHVIHLSLHFPLPSINVEPWLFHSMTHLWDWYMCTVLFFFPSVPGVRL